MGQSCIQNTTTIHKYFAGKPRYLSIDELPAYQVIRGKRYTLHRLDDITGLIGIPDTVTESMTLSLKDALRKTFDMSDACFLTLGSEVSGYTIAIRKFGDDTYWSFDSHSRNHKGTQSASGKAVIMETITLGVLAKFIHELAISISQNGGEMPFEFVPVKCMCSDHDVYPTKTYTILNCLFS